MAIAVRAFISSTFADLVAHRSAVRRVLEMMSIPNLAMEVYVPDERAPVRKCLDDIQKCSVYIGIFAHRYGHIPSGETISITELEYREAGLIGIDRLIFVLKDDVPWNPIHMDSHTKEGDNGNRISALRQELRESNTITFFDTPDDLASKVAAAVHAWHNRRLECDTSPSDERAHQHTQPLLDYLKLCQEEVEDFQAHYVPLTGTVTKRQPFILQFTEAGLWPSAFRVLADSQVRNLRDDYVSDGPTETLLLSLGKGSRAVLAAEAGAGKTIMLRRLRLLLSTELLKSGKGQIPLFINLPEWPSSIDDFRSLVVHERAAIGCPAVPEDDLFLLLDGLDELDPERRVSCISKISRWLDAHPTASVVVAARKTSYRQAYPFRASVIEIQPMARPQIEDFVKKRAVPARASELLSRLFAQDSSLEGASLRYLARSPFNLALVCAVFNFLSGELPTSLGQLLRHLVETLLQREIDTETATPATNKTILRELGRLALGLCGNHVRTIMHVDWARKRVNNPQTFDLVFRVGLASTLLKATKNERVMLFAHSIYQRYFLAEYLSADANILQKLLAIVPKSEVTYFPDHIIETLRLMLELCDQDYVVHSASQHNPCLALVVLDRPEADKSLGRPTVSKVIDELLLSFNDRRLDQVVIQRYVEIVSRIAPECLSAFLRSKSPALRRGVLHISAQIPAADDSGITFSCLMDENRSVRRDATNILDDQLQNNRDQFTINIERYLLQMPDRERHDSAVKMLKVLPFDKLLCAKLIAVGGLSKAEYRTLSREFSLPDAGAAFSIVDTLFEARALVLERQSHQYARRDRFLARRSATIDDERTQREHAKDTADLPDQISRLVEQLGSVGTGEAKTVIRELKSIGGIVCPTLVTSCLKSSNPKLRRRAPRVLAGVHYVQAVPDIIELLQDHDVRVVRDAIIALSQLGDQNVVWAFEEFAYHWDAAVAANAIRGLEMIGGQEAIKIAWKFLGDHRPDVRQMALSALQIHDSSVLSKKIAQFFRDESNEIRRQALQWLTQISPLDGFKGAWSMLSRQRRGCNSRIARAQRCLCSCGRCANLWLRF